MCTYYIKLKKNNFYRARAHMLIGSSDRKAISNVFTNYNNYFCECSSV